MSPDCYIGGKKLLLKNNPNSGIYIKLKYIKFAIRVQMKFTIAFLLVSIGCTYPVAGQRFSLRHYTAVDGLPQSQVYSLVEDENGYLWVGTFWGGLARFDGTEFKVYNSTDGLSSTVITGLVLDSRNRLFVCHPKGVSKMEGGTFKKLRLENRGLRFSKMYELRDTLYLQTWDDKLMATPTNEKSDSLIQVSKTPISLVTYSASKDKLIFLSGDNSLIIKGRSGTKHQSLSNYATKITNLLSVAGYVVLETDKGYFQLNPDNGSISPATIWARNRVVAYDTSQQVYWTTSQRYLFREHKVTNNVRIDTVLKDVEVAEILFDRDGDTWLGTNTGLYKYFRQDFNKLEIGEVGSVMTIEKDRAGAIWLGTTNGLRRIKNGKNDLLSIGASVVSKEITQVKKDRDQKIWISSYNGLAKFDEGTNKFQVYTTEDGLLSNEIKCFDFDSKSGMWLGDFRNGVSYFDGGPVRRIYSVKEGLASNFVFSIHHNLPSDITYIGTDLGLNAIKDEKVEKIDIKELSNSTILSINTFRDSLLLIGSDGAGAAIYNPTTKKSKFFNLASGLPSDLIYFVAADSTDLIWIGTEKGISTIRVNSALEVIENFTFDQDNGLHNFETNHNAFYLGREKYFGMVDEVYQYNDLPQRPSSNYASHLTGIDLFYQPESARKYSLKAEGFFQLPVNPEFPHNQNHLTFHFNRVDKRYPHSIFFQYYLENFDTKWSLPSKQTQVTYSNLPPGSYTFKLKASDHRGAWSETPISYSFVIDTPFYKQGWFIVLAQVLLILLVISLVYWRVRSKALLLVQIEQIKSQEKESIRKELARDFHDEMGNQLTRIINYVSLLKLGGTGNLELYNKVEKSAKHLYSGTRDFIWSIDPSNDDIVKIFLRIKDFAESILSEKEINLRVYNAVWEKIIVDFGVSRDVTLIFKEAITNTFRHSQARNVSFSLSADDRAIQIQLEDDGIGYSIDPDAADNGIKNMKDRADRIGAVLLVSKGTNDFGTRVTLSIRRVKTK